MKFHLLFLVSLIIKICKNEKIISLDYKVFASRPSVDISFVNEELSQKNNYYLNTYLSHTLFKVEDIYGSVPDHLDESITLTSTYPSQNYNTTIKMNENISLNVNCILFKSSSYYCRDSGIGLAYQFKDERESIIHNLYNNKEINKKIFAFMPKNKKLYLGGVPNNDHLHYQNHGLCSIENNLQTWGCNITMLQYNDKAFSFNRYAIFNSADDNIFRSIMIFDFMVNEVINKEIQNGDCHINHKFVTCKQDLDIFKEKFILEMGKVKFSISIRDMFEDRKTEMESLFMRDDAGIVGNEGGFFEFKFFELFNYTVFDYEKGEVHFYSDQSIIVNPQNSSKNKFPIFYIILTCIFSCFINILVLFFHKIKQIN